jgi:hypothetical protein
MTWLARTPLAVVRACLDMLPRLEAEESILAVNRTAVGSGTARRDRAQQVTRSWERAASTGRTRPAIPDGVAFRLTTPAQAPAKA